MKMSSDWPVMAIFHQLTLFCQHAKEPISSCSETRSTSNSRLPDFHKNPHARRLQGHETPTAGCLAKPAYRAQTERFCPACPTPKRLVYGFCRSNGNQDAHRECSNHE